MSEKAAIFEGEKQTWEHIKLISQSDTGDIHLVFNKHTREVAILKKPSSSAFNSSPRQAFFLQREAEILELLASIKFEVKDPNGIKDLHVRAAKLLDTAFYSSQHTSDFFIVTEYVSGFDLQSLQQPWNISNPKGQRQFLKLFANLDDFPSLLLYLMAYGVAGYLKLIHHIEPELPKNNIKGVIWNNIGLDHIFWDPSTHTIVLINWGNGDFLGEDGITADRSWSTYVDWQQYVHTFRNYFDMYGGTVRHQINWPKPEDSTFVWESAVNDMLDQLSRAIDMDTSALSEESHEMIAEIFAKKKQIEPEHLLIQKLQYLFRDKQHYLSWLPNRYATHYEIKICDQARILDKFPVQQHEWEGSLSNDAEFISVRVWSENGPGEWSNFIKLEIRKEPEKPAPLPKFEKPEPIHQPAPTVAAPPAPRLQDVSAPPPLAAPVFRLRGLTALVIMLIFVVTSLIIYLIISSFSSSSIVPSFLPSPVWGQIATIAKGIFVASILSLIPTIAAKLVGVDNRVKLSIAEIFLFAIAIISMGYGLFKLQGNIWWTLAILIVVFLDIGAHLIDSIRESTFRRIDKSWRYKILRKDAAAFDKLYIYERILYAALPLGIMLGTFIGLFQNATEIEIALLSIQAVTVSAFLMLVLITFKSFRQMIVPMYPLSNSPNQPPIFTSKQRDNSKDKEEKMLSLAIMSTDLRKLYLYDSTHNILLMLLFIYSFLITYGVTIEFKILILAILIATLVFSQFPYVLGQYLLHQKALEPFEGMPRADVDEKMKKYAPLYPTFHFLAALLTTGTAGGLAFFLLDNFIKGLFK